MKTYESIKNTAQVQEGDVLVHFWNYPIEMKGKVHSTYNVLSVNSERIELHCPSKAVIYVNNGTLSDETDYFRLFKRVS